MDCEKFDQHVMDALYDELDELTHAAMKRHMEGCARCASTLSGLRATRDAALLPLEEPSDDLEDRIFAAVEVAQRKTPWRRKALRALAWAGSHAMRPQLAMAALFVLVIGSSLLLLRARPGTVGVAPVRVTERGVPAPEQPEMEVAPTPAAAPPAAAPMPAEALAAADPAAAEGKRAEERPADKNSAAEDRAKDEKADRADGAADGAAAALADAQAKKKASGCAAALPLFDEVGTRYPGTAAAHTAMWEAAQCYKAAGDEARARELLLALRSVEGYRAQVESELGEAQANAQNIQAPAKAAAATATAGAPAGKPAAASPARANAPNVYSKPKAAQKAADIPQAAPPNAAGF